MRKSPQRTGSRALLLVPSLLGPVLFLGCGSVKASGGDAGVETAPLTGDQACTMFASSFCARLGDCAPFAVSLFYGDAATCMARAKLGCTKDQEAPDITRTPDDIAGCATDARAASCDDLLAGIFPASCRVKPGVRLAGEGCGSNLQCSTGHCEIPTTDCGVCAARQPAGGDCTANDGCAEGLVCANKKCVTPGQAGASCDPEHPCRGNLYCTAERKVCAAHVGVGTSCMGDADACDVPRGAGCNVFSPTPTCQQVSVAQGGHACGLMSGALTVCVLGDACAGATLLNPTGICTSPAEDGQACSDAARCLPPATCMNGVCRLPSSSSCPK